MERCMRWKSHVQCEVGENQILYVGDYLSPLLNVISLKFQELVDYFKIFDPRYMLIDRNNGKFNRTMGLIKDQLIGLYSFNK